jgi:uncharacterized protein (DUF4415 family)
MIFHDFPNAIFFAPRFDMEEQKTGLQPYFEGSAAPPPERVTVALEMDADVLEWFKAQPLDWQREINNAARFVMDMSSQPVPPIEVYEADFFETAGPDPARNADRIEHDFIP